MMRNRRKGRVPQNGAAPGKNRNGRKEALLWMCGYGKKHIGAIVLYTFLGLAGTLGGLLGSLVSKNLVDIITGHDTGELVKTFALMIGTALATMLIGQVSAYVSSLISVRVANDVKADIFDVIMRTEWEELSRFHSGGADGALGRGFRGGGIRDSDPFSQSFHQPVPVLFRLLHGDAV